MDLRVVPTLWYGSGLNELIEVKSLAWCLIHIANTDVVFTNIYFPHYYYLRFP